MKYSELKEHYTFDELKEIVEFLRGEGGCPWDREQTVETLQKYLIEECYEAVDASKGSERIKFADELGDVLLQVLMNASVCRDEGEFDINTVIDLISKKMIIRHPHVFGDAKAETSEDVLRVWEKVKKKEKDLKTSADLLDDIPKSHPALLLSEKISAKLGKTDAMKLSGEESLELFSKKAEALSEAVKSGNKEAITDRLTALLFATTNLAYTNGITCEESLRNKALSVIDEIKKVDDGDEDGYKKVFYNI